MLIAALNDKSVQEKLQDVICTNLKQEITILNQKLVPVQRDQQINQLENKVQSLENKCDDLEQYSRRNSLRITGIPEKVNDDDPCQKSLDLFESMQINPPIILQDIDRIHRVGPKMENKPRPILVKFSNYQARHRVYKARTKLRKGGRDPNRPWGIQTAANVEADDQPVQPQQHLQVFINEDLTKNRANLLWKARNKKRAKRIYDCWTYDGQVLIKNLVNKIIPIHQESDLNAF